MPSTTTINLTGNQDIDGLLGARKWAVQSLTYSFPTTSGEVTGYLSGEEPSNGFETLNTVQRTVVRKIYSDLSAFTNLSFTEVSGGSGDLRFGMTNNTSTAHAY